MITESEIRSDADEVAYSFQEDCLQAEFLLQQIVGEDRQPNYAEVLYFKTKLGWDEAEVSKQRRRMSNVLRFKAIAGTPQDRQAAIQEAATASDVLAKEGPKVAEQLAKLEAKLRSLESDAKLSTRRCEDQTEAVAKLREHCPQTIVDQVLASRRILNSTLKREIHDAETRIHELSCVLDRDKYPATREGEIFYLESVRRCNWNAVADASKNGIRKLALSPAWPSIRVELEFELAELKAKLEPLQSQYETELAAIEQPLDYYANGSQTE